MGLYDVVLGDGRQAERGRVILGVLATVAPAAPARFRDAWVEQGDAGVEQGDAWVEQGDAGHLVLCGLHPHRRRQP